MQEFRGRFHRSELQSNANCRSRCNRLQEENGETRSGLDHLGHFGAAGQPWSVSPYLPHELLSCVTNVATHVTRSAQMRAEGWHWLSERQESFNLSRRTIASGASVKLVPALQSRPAKAPLINNFGDSTSVSVSGTLAPLAIVVFRGWKNSFRSLSQCHPGEESASRLCTQDTTS